MCEPIAVVPRHVWPVPLATKPEPIAGKACMYQVAFIYIDVDLGFGGRG